MNDDTCCFFGHRKINETEEFKQRLSQEIEKMIVENGVNTFFFGSKSRFNEMCLEIVTNLKKKYPSIRRVYVRAEFPDIDDDYKQYLLKSYEETYYPDKVLGAGKAVYVERNAEMIKMSRFVIVHYNEETAPKMRKSGTKAALDYAKRLKREIISVS